MSPPKCDEMDYINFLIAARQVFSSVEAARTHPAEEAPAHDAYTRLLKRMPPDRERLWQEVEPWVQKKGGVLVLDDTTLDKPCFENGLGDPALVWKTRSRSQGDKSDFFGVDWRSMSIAM